MWRSNCGVGHKHRRISEELLKHSDHDKIHLTCKGGNNEREWRGVLQKSKEKCIFAKRTSGQNLDR